MKKDIKYKWGNDQLSIELGDRILPRIKLLFYAEFLLTTATASVLLIESYPFQDNKLLSIGAALLYLTAAYRFLSRILFRETIILTPFDFIIHYHALFSKKTFTYDRSLIGPIHYLGKDVKTDHPLKGMCFDYFGFETQEQLIQSLHQEGSLYFNYAGFPVRFGRGVYTWHAEEMLQMMQLYCGGSLLLSADWENMLEQQHND